MDDIVNEVVGTVKTHDSDGFVFLSKTNFKKGDFVSYSDTSRGSKILCRVINTTPLREYHESFLMDTNIDAGELAEFIGIDTHEYSYYNVYTKVVGYFDTDLGEFVNPGTKPLSGARIYRADGKILGFVSNVKKGAVGSADIGHISGTDFDVSISVKDIISQHLAVIASTGAGKSYTVGVLVEELMMPKNRAPVLIFDPHGEYSTLSDISNHAAFIDGAYRPKVKIVKKKDIKIKIDDMSVGDFISVMDSGTMSDKMKTLFREAYNSLYNASKKSERPFTKSELKSEIEGMKDQSNESSIDGILWRYSKLNDEIFHDHQTTPITDYFKIGQLTILDVAGISQELQQLLASIMLRKLFDSRMKTENGQYTQDMPEKYLPYPVFVILEEAHRFAPQTGDAKSRNILRTILSEGRKFGIGVCMVSQRPSKLDADSLSQCMTQVTMRIINPADQAQIAQSIESASRDIIDELPGLSRGQAIVSGVGINTPVTVNIRKRLTSDAKGRSKDAPRIWTEAEPEVVNKVVPDKGFDIGV